jgi:hypothetical protein
MEVRNGNCHPRANAIPLCRGGSFSDIPRNRAGRLAGPGPTLTPLPGAPSPECAPCRPASILIKTEAHAHPSSVRGRTTGAHRRGISGSLSVGPGCWTACVQSTPILRARSEAPTKRRSPTAQCARGLALAIRQGYGRDRLRALPRKALCRRRGLDRAARHHLPLIASV